MFKILLPILCLIGCYSSAQTSFNPALWNLTYYDEFNSPTINPEWNYLQPNQPWGTQTFSSDPKYVSVASDGTRSFLNLKAYVENVSGTLKKISGGLVIPDKVWDNTTWQTIENPVNPFFYGYYEIEAKLTIGAQGLANNSIWPAFWAQHSGGDSPGNYWYEEMDIFEPGACYVKDSRNVVHYWTLNNPNDPNTKWNGEGFEGEASVNMQDWHTYGLLWMPDRIVYYQDGQPFHSCTGRVPSHQKPALFIDLQTDGSCSVGNNSANQFVGAFQVNYFRYYTPKSCNAPITEIIGNNYNFTGWVNSPNNVREYCRFKNTTTPASSNIQVFSEDVYLISDFEVPAGSSFEVVPEYCD
jgi:hypothetical protein